MTYTKLYLLPNLVGGFDAGKVVYAITRDSAAPTGFRNENISGEVFAGVEQESEPGSTRLEYFNNFNGQIASSTTPFFPPSPYQGVNSAMRVDDYLFSAKLSNHAYSDSPLFEFQDYPQVIIGSKQLPEQVVPEGDFPDYGDYDVLRFAEIHVTLWDDVTKSFSRQVLTLGRAAGDIVRFTKVHRLDSGPTGSSLEIHTRPHIATYNSFAQETPAFLGFQLLGFARDQNPPADASKTVYLSFYQSHDNLFIGAAIRPQTTNVSSKFRLGVQIRVRGICHTVGDTN